MNREEKTKKFLRILTFGGMLVLAALSALSCAACASEAEKPYAEGRILVKLARTGKSENAALSLAAGGFSEERAAGMTVAKSWHFSPSDAEARTGGAARTLAADADEGATIALLVSETMTTEQMLAAAAQDEAIEYAEPDYKIYPTSVPDDPGFSEQWAYNGEENRPTGGSAHLEITGAWEQAASQQTNEVVVAVVDTGVDYGHPDLQNNMWNGENDGYDNHGWNATEAKDSEAYKDPMDSDGHGTHVAGIIAAVPGNGQGIAGAARSVKILAAKVLGGGEGFSSFVIDTYSNLLALKKAGVNIVATNNSWTAPILSKSAGEAMERLGAAGVVNVIAAANDHADNDVTPGFPYNLASDYSVVVAASTPWDEIAEFSNYGRRSVHIAAPGAWILSTYSRKVPNPERSMLENSFVKAFAEEQDKLFYYGDFATADGLTPGPGQSVSTDNGYLEWTVTAGSAGTYRLKIDAAIDLKSVNAESGSEFKDELHLCVTSMSDKSFSLSLCAPDEEGGVNRDSRVVVGGNFNHDGNFWKGQITKISDPYWYAPEFESFPRYGEAELVWASDSAYLELSINLDAGESRTVKVKEIAITQGAPYNPDAPYRYMDGTSMASPAAAGCLALIASLNPDMSAAELRARIIGGAVKIPSMKDKLLTGGRLSVNKALEDPSPVVNSLSASGGLLAVEGFFFGDSEGVAHAPGRRRCAGTIREGMDGKQNHGGASGYPLRLVRSDGDAPRRGLGTPYNGARGSQRADGAARLHAHGYERGEVRGRRGEWAYIRRGLPSAGGDYRRFRMLRHSRRQVADSCGSSRRDIRI